MEENKQEQIPKKPVYKKWWFWMIIGIIGTSILSTIIIGTSILSTILIKTGVVDGGVNVRLENYKQSLTYESLYYYQNVECKVSYKLDNFKSSYVKTNVINGYVYYDVTISFHLDCQLTFDGVKYNDDNLEFTPCVIFYSKDNTEFEKVVKTMTVKSGHTYDFSFKIENVCGGKEKEFSSFNYYVKLSVPTNE